MPYYVFEMTTTEGMTLVKNLRLMDTFESYKEAKQFARDKRTAIEPGSAVSIKLMFAENQLVAEEQLLEHRDKPVIMEHEK
jgi:hypothetical protein